MAGLDGVIHSYTRYCNLSGPLAIWFGFAKRWDVKAAHSCRPHISWLFDGQKEALKSAYRHSGCSFSVHVFSLRNACCNELQLICKQLITICSGSLQFDSLLSSNSEILHDESFDLKINNNWKDCELFVIIILLQHILFTLLFLARFLCRPQIPVATIWSRFPTSKAKLRRPLLI